MAPPGDEHGRLAFRVGRLLATFTDTHRLGDIRTETGFLLRRDPDLVRAPDTSFVRRERRQEPERRQGFFDGPPDLAIEIVSPGDTADELARKVEEYLLAGTGRVWVIQPTLGTVVVYRPGFTAHTFHANETLDSSDAGFDIAGLSLPVADLFADEP